MPSDIAHKIAQDCLVAPEKLDTWYKEAHQEVDKEGWSPNEGRYWSYIHKYVERKLTNEVSNKRMNLSHPGATHSRAFHSLLRSYLLELDAEKQGTQLQL
jgi:hypothetical protein